MSPKMTILMILNLWIFKKILINFYILCLGLFLVATTLYHFVLPYRGLTADSLVQSAMASIMMMVVVLVDLHRGGAGEGGPFGYTMYVHSVRLVVTEPHFLLRNPPEDLNSFTVTCYQSTSTTMKIPKKYPKYCNNHAATAWSKIKWFLSKPDLIGRWLSWQDFQVYIIILTSEALMEIILTFNSQSTDWNGGFTFQS